MGECLMFGRGTIQPWAPDSTFANNDWKNIIKAVQKGVVPDTWKVGDQKPMTVGGVDYDIEIIAKNHDEYSDGSGLAPLTLQMYQLTTEQYVMNSPATNAGGWETCYFRTTTLPTLLTTFPDEVQAALKEVNKSTTIGNGRGQYVTTADKLFLLSEYELFGYSTYGFANEGKHYAIYNQQSVRKKIAINNTPRGWWTRSPHSSGSSGFCNINASGNANYYDSSAVTSISLAFCF